MSRNSSHRRRGRKRQESDLRHWADRVSDIVVAARECIEFTAGMTQAQFAADLRTRKAVLMNLVIIGEAAGRTPRRVAASHPEVEWQDLRELRNFVVHVYFRVEPGMVWETVRGDLPRVIHRLEGVLEDRRRGRG